MSLLRDMRFHRPLDSVLRRSTTIQVLRPLAWYASRAFTGRELARLSGVSPQQALRSLNDLEREGIVRGQVTGRARLWSLGHEHLLVPGLTSLLELDRAALEELLSVLRDGLSGADVDRVRLFGSIARGEERPESDIDLLVEARTAAHPALMARTTKLIQTVSTKFGNTLSPLLVDPHRPLPPGLRALLKAADREGIDVLEEDP